MPGDTRIAAWSRRRLSALDRGVPSVHQLPGRGLHAVGRHRREHARGGPLPDRRDPGNLPGLSGSAARPAARTRARRHLRGTRSAGKLVEPPAARPSGGRGAGPGGAGKRAVGAAACGCDPGDSLVGAGDRAGGAARPRHRAARRRDPRRALPAHLDPAAGARLPARDNVAFARAGSHRRRRAVRQRRARRLTRKPAVGNRLLRPQLCGRRRRLGLNPCRQPGRQLLCSR